MNSGMERYKKKRLAVSVVTVSALIILIQFIDSYCTEIFGRTQSLSARTFLMIPKGMDGDSAIAYMSRMMLPFYLIGMLTPFVRSYTDIIGRKRMLIINVSLLVAGSVICIFAENLPVYLLGNGVLILGYDIYRGCNRQEIPGNSEGNMRRRVHGSGYVHTSAPLAVCEQRWRKLANTVLGGNNRRDAVPYTGYGVQIPRERCGYRMQWKMGKQSAKCPL